MRIGRLLLRITVGGFFFGHGTQKLFGWFGGKGLDATAQGFEAMGLHPARRNAIAAGAAEAGGGALLVAACHSARGLGLTATMLTAIETVHGKNGPWLSEGGYEYNVVLIAAVLALAEVGPGALSLDGAGGATLGDAAGPRRAPHGRGRSTRRGRECRGSQPRSRPCVGVSRSSPDGTVCVRAGSPCNRPHNIVIPFGLYCRPYGRCSWRGKARADHGPGSWTRNGGETCQGNNRGASLAAAILAAALVAAVAAWRPAPKSSTTTSPRRCRGTSRRSVSTPRRRRNSAARSNWRNRAQ